MKIDYRKVDPKTLEHTRILAVKRVQKGESPTAVASSLGVSAPSIFSWLAKYRNGGWDSLRVIKGQGGGRPGKLKAKHIQFIYKSVTGGDPRQYRFSFALWTRDLVKQLIWKKFKIKLSRWSVGRLMHQLGLSPQKPLKRAYQKDPVKVDRWLKKQFPQIKAFAKKNNATIYFGDEAGIRSDHQAGTTWGEIGITPIVDSNGARVSVNMISAITSTGKMKFMIIKKKFSADVFIEFIKKLIEDNKMPVILIVDGHPVHKSAKVKNFIKTIKDRFRMFLLPPYSPELNPDELVWNDLKNNDLGRKVATNKEDLKKLAISGLKRIQKQKGKVESYFKSKHTSYAAF